MHLENLWETLKNWSYFKVVKRNCPKKLLLIICTKIPFPSLSPPTQTAAEINITIENENTHRDTKHKNEKLIHTKEIAKEFLLYRNCCLMKIIRTKSWENEWKPSFHWFFFFTLFDPSQKMPPTKKKKKKFNQKLKSSLFP